MKNTIKLFGLTMLAAGFWACGNNASVESESAPSGKTLLANTSHRGKEKVDLAKLSSVERFSTDLLKGIDISTIETMRISNERTQQSEDAAFVVSLFNNLLAAQSEATALNMNFSMSDEPVEDGLFVFTIKADQKEKLKFEMYDEEGFELSANNALQLIEGTNYKAINVSGLNSGNYIFKLKNANGDELVRKVNIQQK